MAQKPHYFPQAFLVWHQSWNSAEDLKQSKIGVPRYAKIAKIGGSYMPEAVMSQISSQQSSKKAAIDDHFLNIDNHKISALVPKVELFRVDGTRFKPFYFPNSADYDFAATGKLKTNKPFSGAGAGITNFQINLIGKNPYEASRKMLSANLSIYVEHMSVLFNSPSDKFANIADLFTIRDKSKSNRGALTGGQNCKIAAILGYAEPDPNSDIFTPEDINAIERSKSLVNLYYSGHDLNIQPNGAATINVNYTGYLESVTSEGWSDIVTNSAVKAAVAKTVTDETQDFSKKAGKINKFFSEEDKKKREREKQKKKSTKKTNEKPSVMDTVNAFGRIINSLYRKGKIHHVDFDDRYFEGKYVKEEDEKEPTQKTKKNTAVTATDQRNLKKLLDPNQPRKINYFNFGDLVEEYFHQLGTDLEEAKKTAESTEAKEALQKIIDDFKTITFLTSNFVSLRNKQTDDPMRVVRNIADIPISLDTFYTYVYNEIVIDSLVFYDMHSVLTEFFLEILEKSFAKFNTADFVETSGFRMVQFTGRDLKSNIRGGTVDISGIPSQAERFTMESISNSSHYCIYIQDPPRYTKSVGSANRSLDSKSGIVWLEASKNKGLVQSISFSKVSLPAREAYLIVRNGDAYDELRWPHDATVTMIGNNLFMPNGYVYINPESLGFGSPLNLNSAARRLGIGGYYAIETVSTTFTPGKLTTTLKLLFNAFPDVNKQGGHTTEQKTAMRNLNQMGRIL